MTEFPTPVRLLPPEPEMDRRALLAVTVGALMVNVVVGVVVVYFVRRNQRVSPWAYLPLVLAILGQMLGPDSTFANWVLGVSTIGLALVAWGDVVARQERAPRP